MGIVSPSSTSVGASNSLEMPTWRWAMKQAIRDPEELCDYLGIPPHNAWISRAMANQFPLFVPRDYASRMNPRDPEDPLLRQVLPALDELQSSQGFHVDPVGDHAASVRPGLIQKYQGRVLLVLTGACAVHCRYCFRRHFPYASNSASPRQWESAIARIASDEAIQEVILSGGDPLTLNDQVLQQLVLRLAEIPQLRRLRVHTRLPVMIPERITEELIDWLTSTRLASFFVIHANHPAELSTKVCEAIALLIDAGVPVLNQAVLLRGVNDDIQSLTQLCLRLVNHRIIPYYLHQLDRVQGAAHFEVDVQRGCQLIEQLRCRVPGYAIPRYVREQRDDPSKRPLHREV